jgi:hypothetical protein
MRVVPIGGYYMVLFSSGADRADGHGFLADVQVQEAADLARLIKLGALLLESTNQYHLAIPIE